MTVESRPFPSTRQVFVATVVVVATVTAAYLLFRLAEIVLLLFVAVILASAVRPLVTSLEERGVRRGVAVLGVYALVLAAAAALMALAVPPALRLGMAVYQDGLLDRSIAGLEAELRRVGLQSGGAPILTVEVVPRIEQAINQARGEAGRQAAPMAKSAVLVVGQIVLAMTMGFYWLTSRQTILDLVLSMTPVSSRSRVELVWSDIEETLSSWIRGQAILSTAVGVLVYLGLVLLHVPFAPALGVLAAITEVIPIVGPWMGAIPAVLVALTVGPETALLTGAWFLLVQQFEGMVLVPHVMRRSVGLHPLVVISALIAGATLDGIVGALVAIPVAGVAQVLARHMVIGPAIVRHAAVPHSGGVLVGPSEPPAPEGAVARPHASG